MIDVVLLQVQFEVSDATKRSFPDRTFDVVYSRDTILHIKDKVDLFRKFYVSVPTDTRMCDVYLGHVLVYESVLTRVSVCGFKTSHL